MPSRLTYLKNNNFRAAWNQGKTLQTFNCISHRCNLFKKNNNFREILVINWQSTQNMAKLVTSTWYCIFVHKHKVPHPFLLIPISNHENETQSISGDQHKIWQILLLQLHTEWNIGYTSSLTPDFPGLITEFDTDSFTCSYNNDNIKWWCDHVHCKGVP